MSLAKFANLIEALTGQVPTNARTLRVALRFHALTRAPDFSATNAQKAVAGWEYLRQHLRGLNADGEEALFYRENPDDFAERARAAGATAQGEL